MPVFDDFTKSKSIIIECFEYLSKNAQVKIYAFVIMKDHIHVVWQIDQLNAVNRITSRFKAHTGKMVITYLRSVDPDYVLRHFKSDRQDRIHKFWKINSGCLELKHSSIIKQKIKYTHLNPTVGLYKVVDDPNEYHYSSSNSYSKLTSEFSFLNFY